MQLILKKYHKLSINSIFLTFNLSITQTQTDISAFINKAIKYNFGNIEKLCKTYIKSKYIKIDKRKKMISTIKRL